eukprot:TRINITY_DN2814_c0_g1_i1.p1 TRINITY_DN2814_c0_g1~~TRINITY_DN2814_c0_g1_i1.p1  ORF type:complete len:544 (-),score=58.46 TRINITY_DN2814_c0_g1_i1:5-1534(-)
MSPSSILQQNLVAFSSLVEEAESEKVHIIVFPEGGLGWTFGLATRKRNILAGYCEPVPALESINSTEIIPCVDPHFDKFMQLHSLSCMAKETGIIMVVNMCDLVQCDQATDPHCPTDGHYLYNSNVVFGEKGQILAKYHKMHPFGEDGVFDTTQERLQRPFFDTWFGVRFGLFICFDIQFLTPARELLAQGIRDFAYPTWWSNRPPLHTALSFQQAWSLVHQSNLIAANTGQDPRSGGGGIYSAGNALATDFIINDTLVRKLVYAVLPTNLPSHPPPWSSTDPSSDIPFSSATSFSASAPPHELDEPICTAPDTIPCDGPVGSVSPQYLESRRLSRSMKGNGILPGCCRLFRTNELIRDIPYTFSSQHSNISCSATILLSSSFPSSVSENWALFAFDDTVMFPFTPDTLSVSTCAIMRCETKAGHMSCLSSWLNDAIFAELTLHARHFKPDNVVFPFVSIYDSRPLNSSDIFFTQNAISGAADYQLSTKSRLAAPLFSASIYSVVGLRK